MKLLSHSTLAMIGLLATPLAAQGSILPYLPEKTIAAVAVPDLNASIAEFGKMPLAKMWAEEEVQTFLADVKQLVKKQIEEHLAQAKAMHEKGQMPVDPEEILKLRVNGGTLALTQLEIDVGELGPEPKIGVVLHLDFGESAPAWGRLVELGLSMLEQQAGNQLVKSDSKVGDVQVRSFQPNDARAGEHGLHIALIPGGVILGTLPGDVRGIVENMQKKTPALAASADYRAVAKHLDTAGAECEMFVRTEPLVEFGLSALRIATQMNRRLAMVNMDGVERAVEAMGFRHPGPMGLTSNYVDGKCVTRAFVASGKAAGTTTAKSVDMSFLKWVPKDAVSFSAGTMNVASVYDTLVKGLEAYDPEFAKGMLARLGDMEAKLGFSVRDDLFGSLGDHYVSWSMAMGSIMAPPEMAYLVKVNNEENLVKALKNVAKASNGILEIEEGEKRGVKAYQLRINFDPTQGMGGFNIFDTIQPTFAFKSGYLVAGLSASDVKRVFQRMDREDDPKGDIRGNKEYAAIAGQLPAGVESVAFTDTKAQFESLYQMASGLLAFVPMGEDVPIDTSLLPDSGTLTKHLFGSLTYSKTEAEGTATTYVGPYGPEVVIGLVGAMAAAGAGVAVSGQRGF